MSNKNVGVGKSQEITFYLLADILMFMAVMVAGRAEAGVALGTTRVIYPAGQRQAQLAVTNNNENSTYLIQSWAENINDAEDGRFTIASPLFAMKGKKEDTLCILDATNNQLPQDRESLFWIDVEATPSVDKSRLTEDTLQLVTINRIKLYYYPAKLVLPPDQAAERSGSRRNVNSLTLINPTSYYLTVTELDAGTRILESALVSPVDESTVKLLSDTGSNITYRTINDYGVLALKMTGVME